MRDREIIEKKIINAKEGGDDTHPYSMTPEDSKNVILKKLDAAQQSSDHLSDFSITDGDHVVASSGGNYDSSASQNASDNTDSNSASHPEDNLIAARKIGADVVRHALEPWGSTAAQIGEAVFDHAFDQQHGTGGD